MAQKANKLFIINVLKLNFATIKGLKELSCQNCYTLMYITHFNMENMNKDDLSYTSFQFALVKWGDGLNWIETLAQGEKKYHLGGYTDF